MVPISISTTLLHVLWLSDSEQVSISRRGSRWYLLVNKYCPRGWVNQQTCLYIVVSPMGLDCVPIDLFVQVSHLSQFFHSWLQSFSCPVTMHMWTLTHQLTILTISYAISWYKQKEQGILGESGILVTTSMEPRSRRNSDANSFIWSLPLYMYFFRNIDVK